MPGGRRGRGRCVEQTEVGCREGSARRQGCVGGAFLPKRRRSAVGSGGLGNEGLSKVSKNWGRALFFGLEFREEFKV